MVRPSCRLVRAASAVRTLARTEMFMPTKPVAPDSSAPMHEGGGRKPAEEQEDEDGDDDADDGDRRILAAQIGRGAFLDRAGDFDHARIAGRGAEHLLAGENAVKQRDDAAGDRDEDQIHVVNFPCSTLKRRAAMPAAVPMAREGVTGFTAVATPPCLSRPVGGERSVRGAARSPCPRPGRAGR